MCVVIYLIISYNPPFTIGFTWCTLLFVFPKYYVSRNKGEYVTYNAWKIGKQWCIAQLHYRLPDTTILEGIRSHIYVFQRQFFMIICALVMVCTTNPRSIPRVIRMIMRISEKPLQKCAFIHNMWCFFLNCALFL